MHLLYLIALTCAVQFISCTQECADGLGECIAFGDWWQYSCINESQRCDGLQDCVFGREDEVNCLDCKEGARLCEDKSRCVPQSSLCDGYTHCDDNSDELNCTTCRDGHMCGCLPHQGECKPSGQCVKAYQLADGTVDCQEGDDEPCARSGAKFIRFVWHCVNASRKNALISYLGGLNCSKTLGPCGTRKDKRCETGEWLCTDQPIEDFYQLDYSNSYGISYDRCLESKPSFGFKCLEVSEVSQRFKSCSLPQGNIYGDISHCGDDADLCFVDGEFKCFLCLDGRLVISQSQVCDGIIDCYDLSDECLCEDQTLCNAIMGDARETCPPDQIHCHNATDCMDIEKALCNDEANCVRQSNIPCSGFQKENAQLMFCDGAEGLDHVVPSVSKCDGRLECFDFSDECDGCEDRPLFCNDTCSISNAIYGAVCRGFIDPSTGKSVCNETIKDLCPKRYTCQNNEKYTSIDVDMLCDGRHDCDDQSDELETRCKNTRYYCDNAEPLSVDIDLVEDGLKQCSDGSDECPAVSKYATVFSDTKEMIANPFFRGMFWVMGFLAGCGNLAVFVATLKDLVTDKNAKIIKQMNNIFIVNLSLADFLMGVYLLGVAAKSAQLSGKYCLNDVVWRTSVVCNVFGFFVITASAASASIMATMTAYRLYTVCNPFATTTLELKRIYLSCIGCWIISITLGTVPLFYYPSGYFASHVWFPNLFYKTDRVPRNETLLLAKRIVKENFSDIAWYDVKQLISSTFPQYPIRGEFSYYSETSVCMPRLFASVNEASWQYSALLITLNFLLFMFMVVAYVVIYRKSNGMSKAKKKQVNSKVQRRISRLLFTDFCCWIPLCVCAYLALSGVELSKDVYIVSAGILLPINSAMNPLLYSNLFDKLSARCSKFVAAKSRKSTRGNELP